MGEYSLMISTCQKFKMCFGKVRRMVAQTFTKVTKIVALEWKNIKDKNV